MAVTVVVHSYVPAVTAIVHHRIEAALAKAAMDIEAHAKQLAPVDTGALKNAINANGGGLAWRVDSPAAYSTFQEFGTRKMPAHPYMVPAVEIVRPSFLQAMRSLT